MLQGFAAAFSNQYVLYLNPDDSGRPLGEQEVLVRGDQSTFPETIELQPGDAIRFTLVYEPTEGGQRGGQFSFTADREIRIPIEHSDDRPEFMQDPVSLDFGRVEAGGRKLEIIKVTNVGTAIGTLEEVSISGSDIFSITIEGRDPQEEPRVLDNPDRDPELGVGLGKAFDILVRCTPENDEPADAEVSILSDATNEEILIPVRANYPEETP